MGYYVSAIVGHLGEKVKVGFVAVTTHACQGQKAIHFSVDLAQDKASLADMFFAQASKAKQMA